MSGQQTIQELDRIVGTTNELLLSPEVKMMEVSPGVWRPTNAMVMANLATVSYTHLTLPTKRIV